MYTQYTQASLAREISVALQDPNNIYWKTDEIYRTIDESLLLWGALTSYWRERGSFTANTRIPFYDLAIYFPTLRARTYTFNQLATEIQYHLIEPPTGVAGTGMTDQFSITQILSSLARKRNEFVLDSRLPIVNTQDLTWDEATMTWDQLVLTWDQLASTGFPVIAPGNGIAQLDPSVALIARASWTDSLSGITTALRRVDSWQMQSMNPNWTLEPGYPNSFSAAETQPLEIQLYPSPLSSGRVNLQFIQSLSLTPPNSTTRFLIPDEFASALKWATLYELLSTDGQGYDPIRAQYCLERYNQLITATQIMRSIIGIRINDKPLALDQISNLDAFSPFWQSQYGLPTNAACMYDMLALSKVPNTTYGITCDLVRSAPLPADPSAFIQLGREDMPYIFDYCRHALSFKLGGSEFTSTMPLYDNFLRGAGQRNKLLSVKAKYLTPIFSIPAKQEGTVHAA